MLLWGSHPSPLTAPNNGALHSQSLTLQPLQAVSGTAHPSSLPGSDLQSLSFSIQPPSASGISGWGAQGLGIDCLCRPLSIFPSANWLLCSPLRRSSPSVPPVRGLPGCRNLSSLTAPSQGHRSCPSSFLSLSLFFLHLSYPVMWRFSCHFRSLRSSANIR